MKKMTDKQSVFKTSTVKNEGYKWYFQWLIEYKKLDITCSILTISCKALVNVLNILKPHNYAMV